jgi:hypothetical protein
MTYKSPDNPPVGDHIDLEEWFTARGIKVTKAKNMVTHIKKHYPELGRYMAASPDVRPELELVQLVFDTKAGRFPPPKE